MVGRRFGGGSVVASVVGRLVRCGSDGGGCTSGIIRS